MWNNTLLSAADSALADLRHQIHYPKLEVEDVIANDLVETSFVRLTAAYLRLAEIATPKRNEEPNRLIPFWKREKVYARQDLIATFRDNPFLITKPPHLGAYIYDQTLPYEWRLAGARTWAEVREVERQQEVFEMLS
jgi:hypothetical protein